MKSTKRPYESIRVRRSSMLPTTTKSNYSAKWEHVIGKWPLICIPTHFEPLNTSNGNAASNRIHHSHKFRIAWMPKIYINNFALCLCSHHAFGRSLVDAVGSVVLICFEGTLVHIHRLPLPRLIMSDIGSVNTVYLKATIRTEFFEFLHFEFNQQQFIWKMPNMIAQAIWRHRFWLINISE